MSLIDEIREQPAILESLTARPRPDIEAAAKAIRDYRPSFILIAARGSSDNAARYAKYLFGIRNRIPVALAAPSLFSLYEAPLRLDHALVIAISQSGQSPDIVGVIDKAEAQQQPTIAITNDPDSPLGSAAGFVIDLATGPERAVAATKTYTTQLATLASLSEAVQESPPGEMYTLGRSLSAVLAESSHIERAVGDFANAQHSAVVGRGFHLSTAFEWALKIEELAQQIAHPYSVADFLHGPIAAVDEHLPLFAIATEGKAYANVIDMLGRLERQRNPVSLVITDQSDSPGDHTIRIPPTPEWLAPIPAIVAAQLFVYHLTIARGLDPDEPRGLRKVTRTV